MSNNTLKAFTALALLGSTSVLTLNAAPAHAESFGCFALGCPGGAAAPSLRSLLPPSAQELSISDPSYYPSINSGNAWPQLTQYRKGLPISNPGYSQIGGGFPQPSFPPYGQGMPVANPGYFPQMNGGYQPMRPAYSMPPSGFSSYSVSPYQPRF